MTLDTFPDISSLAEDAEVTTSASSPSHEACSAQLEHPPTRAQSMCETSPRDKRAGNRDQGHEFDMAALRMSPVSTVPEEAAEPGTPPSTTSQRHPSALKLPEHSPEPKAGKDHEASPPSAVPSGQKKAMSLAEYVASQLHVSVHAPARDALFGETRRDKLYNSLFWVGPHLERFMAVGLLACLDCFLVRPRWRRLACISVRCSMCAALHARMLHLHAKPLTSSVTTQKLQACRRCCACCRCALRAGCSRRSGAGAPQAHSSTWPSAACGCSRAWRCAR
jgi:hypothetical protein